MNEHHNSEEYKDFPNYQVIMDYAESIKSDENLASKETKQMIDRFYRDLENEEYLFKPDNAEKVISIIEDHFTYDADLLLGEPLLLEPWQKFIIYNLVSFYYAEDEDVRRFKEAFISLPNRRGKSRFVAALAWSLSFLNDSLDAETHIVAPTLPRANYTLGFLTHIAKLKGLYATTGTTIYGSAVYYLDHFKIRASAANPDRQDIMGCNIAIADDIHTYKTARPYNLIKDAMKTYTNRLMIGITTVGSRYHSFCYERSRYCKQILDGAVENESYFVFIAEADED